MPDGSLHENRAQSVATSFPTGVAANDPPPAEARVRRRHPAPPPVNIRLSVPILKSRFYFSIMGGRERRSRERLAIERRYHRVATTPNVLFIVIGALALYMITLGGFLAYSAMSGA